MILVLWHASTSNPTYLLSGQYEMKNLEMIIYFSCKTVRLCFVVTESGPLVPVAHNSIPVSDELSLCDPWFSVWMLELGSFTIRSSTLSSLICIRCEGKWLASIDRECEETTLNSALKLRHAQYLTLKWEFSHAVSNLFILWILIYL